MIDPYLIPRPAKIAFSGGESSGYMLGKILQAYGGLLPEDVHVVFANTGKENEHTLTFVQRCAEHYGVRVVWVEFAGVAAFEQVSHNSAHRKGEPFEQAIAYKGFLPNMGTKWCSYWLKAYPARQYMKSLGFSRYSDVLGFRADERVGRVDEALAANASGKLGYTQVMPMAQLGVTLVDVERYWASMPFRLEIPRFMGNCDGCWKKHPSKLIRVEREKPGTLAWWAQQEADLAGKTKEKGAAFFRNDGWTYDELIRFAEGQGHFFDTFDLEELTGGCTDECHPFEDAA